MWLTSIATLSVALTGGVKIFKEQKRRREKPWTVYAERIAKKKQLRVKKRSTTETELNKRPKEIIIRPTPGVPPKLLEVSQIVWKMGKHIQPFFGDLRYQHREAIADEAIEVSEIEKTTRFRIRVSFINLGLTTVAVIFYKPLLIGAVPLYLYTVGAVYKDALTSLLRERQAKPALLSALAASGFLIGGMFLTAAFELWVSAIIRYLVIKTEDHSKRSLSSLFGKPSSSVWIVKGGAESALTGTNEIEIPLSEVRAGDIAVVGSGQIIPVDGVIVAGMASIDQHKLTGEAQPAEKTTGDQVLASTVIHSGQIYIRVEKTGEETVAAQIGHLLNQTSDFREVIQSRADMQSGKMITPMLALSALALPIGGINSATALFMNVPAYKMRYFGPISMLNYLNISAQQSILIKDGRSLEQLRDIDTVVFDKTGTLTLEQPQVHQIHSCNGFSSDELLTFAAAAEERQSHPIARAILAAAREAPRDLPSIEDLHYEVGYGIKVRIMGQIVRVGSERFMTMTGIQVPDEIRQLQSSCHEKGYSLVMIAIDNQLAGAIELRPTIRPDAAETIRQLQERQLELVIISGDHEGPTRQLAQQLGIERYFAQVLPEDKANLVGQLQQEGRSVCFVGDGINDAIALKKANVSISLQGATTVATDTAQIILMDGKLSKLIDLFNLAQDFEENLKSNLAISIIPAFCCIGGIFLLGWSALTAVVIGEVVFFTGFFNAMSPLVKHINQESRTNAEKA